MNLQYISAAKATEFIDTMGEIPTEVILRDEAIVQLLSGSVPQQITSKENPLGMVECFLQLFVDREEFEVCQQLVDLHPALKLPAE